MVKKMGKSSKATKNYESAKRAYHDAGKKARGKPQGSKERKDYENAKKTYHSSGQASKSSGTGGGVNTIE